MYAGMQVCRYGGLSLKEAPHKYQMNYYTSLEWPMEA